MTGQNLYLKKQIPSYAPECRGGGYSESCATEPPRPSENEV